jgi:O-acetyl-ADP-ribose deacetylase (regulator of RNase III)
MIFVKGNLLEGQTHIIMHQVNCKGIWGAGLAKQIRDKYPDAFVDYKRLCDEKGSKLLGHSRICVAKDRTIFSIFGQDGYGRDRQYTDYDALISGVKEAIRKYRSTEQSYQQLPIGIPCGIGCGLAGGDWLIVKKLLENIEEKENVIFICYEL